MQANLNWLTDPEVFRFNRLDAHSDHLCYATAQEMEQGTSSLYQSLDGCWKFAWSRNPSLRPEGFWQEGFDDSWFGTISVPGHIELQGFRPTPNAPPKELIGIHTGKKTSRGEITSPRLVFCFTLGLAPFYPLTPLYSGSFSSAFWPSATRISWIPSSSTTSRWGWPHSCISNPCSLTAGIVVSVLYKSAIS